MVAPGEERTQESQSLSHAAGVAIVVPPADRRNGSGAPTEALGDELGGIACEMVHHIEGRVRLRVPLVRTDPAFGERAVNALARKPGVQQARLSRYSGSIVVYYDPAAISVAGIAEIVRFHVPAARTPGAHAWQRPA